MPQSDASTSSLNQIRTSRGGWPTLDPANPATDYQLQQALVLARAMATTRQAVLR